MNAMNVHDGDQAHSLAIVTDAQVERSGKGSIVFRHKRYFAAGAAVAIAVGVAALAGTADAAPTTVTAVTHIINDPDNGNGGVWATDNLERTVTVSVAVPNTAPAGFVAYNASVTDTGTFITHAGAGTPNQSVPGQKLAHDVPGTLTGTDSYTIVAPAADALGSGAFQVNLNDANNAPAAPFNLSQWPAQAFAGAVVVNLVHFNYTYVTAAGESWADSDTNSDGNLVSDGNIIGLLAPPPVIIRLSQGHGTATAPTRETVSFKQSGAASWDEFYIVGPGPIDKHMGWVNAALGLNFGYYEGLNPGHGYSVFFTPVEGQGSNVQVPDSHGGHVYFVSNQ